MNKVRVTLTAGVGDYTIGIKGNYESEIHQIIVERNDDPLTRAIFTVRKQLRGYSLFSFEYELIDNLIQVSQIYEDQGVEKSLLICRIPTLLIDKISEVFHLHLDKMPEKITAECEIDLYDINKCISLNYHGNPKSYHSHKATAAWIAGENVPQPTFDSLIEELSEVIEKSLRNKYDGIMYKRGQDNLRKNYVRKDTDEKVFLFYSQAPGYNLALAVTESGHMLREGGGGDDYESAMKEMEAMLSERFWKYIPIRTKKGDPRLIEALRKSEDSPYLQYALK